MQARWGHAVDGTRTYNEQTVHWLALYFGWPTVLLGGGRVRLLSLADAVRRRACALIAALATGLLSMSALYLWNSRGAPDQPWAMRRYVPVVLPLLLVAAAAALRRLWRHRSAIGRSGTGRAPDVVAARCAVVAAALALVLSRAVTSWPMRHVRDESPAIWPGPGAVLGNRAGRRGGPARRTR